MRCSECNVELAENATRCVLCGAKAVNEEPKMPQMILYEYPKYGKRLPVLVPIKRNSIVFEKYVFYICVFSAVALVIAAICGIKQLWVYGVPAVYALGELVCLVGSFFRKRFRTVGIKYMLDILLVLILNTVAAAIEQSALRTMIASVCIAVASVAVLVLTHPVDGIERLKMVIRK